jgi:mannose-6-phosphate isomerase-like protein (cupin superfamily)
MLSTHARAPNLSPIIDIGHALSLHGGISSDTPGRPTMIEFTEKPGGDDPRGLSFPLNEEIAGFLHQAHGCHIATILPSQIRGNHYHQNQKEILFVLAGLPWVLYWDSGEGQPVQSHAFTGENAVLVKINPGASHALVNTGAAPLTMVGLSDRPYDPAAPDAFIRKVTP